MQSSDDRLCYVIYANFIMSDFEIESDKENEEEFGIDMRNPHAR